MKTSRKLPTRTGCSFFTNIGDTQWRDALDARNERKFRAVRLGTVRSSFSTHASTTTSRRPTVRYQVATLTSLPTNQDPTLPQNGPRLTITFPGTVAQLSLTSHLIERTLDRGNPALGPLYPTTKHSRTVYYGTARLETTTGRGGRPIKHSFFPPNPHTHPSFVNINTGRRNVEMLSFIYLRGSGAPFQNVLPEYKQKKKITYKFNNFYDRSDKLVWHSYAIRFYCCSWGFFFIDVNGRAKTPTKDYKVCLFYEINR